MSFSGSFAPTPAPGGSYAPVAGLSAALPAPPGYFVNTTGAVSFTAAPAGTYIAASGAFLATPAPAGTYAPVAGMSAAIPAPPGYFVSTLGAAALTPAPAGSFVPGNGAVAATPDAPGYFTPISGMRAAIKAGDLNNDGLVTQSELNAALTNYWANNPWLCLTNLAGLGGTNVSFDLTNGIEGAYSVLYSTDLTNWYGLGTANPRYSFSDSNAPAIPQRFYRLSWP